MAGFMEDMFGVKPKGDEKKGDDPNKALMESIERINARLDATEQRFSTLQAPSASQAAAADTAPAVPQLDLSGLPDPFVDPEAYGKAFSEKQAAYTQSLLQYQRDLDRQQSTADQQFNAKADGLWQSFKSAHAGYAKNEALVRFAAGEVAARAAAKGQDVQQYIFSNPTRYMDEVVKELDTLGVKPADADPEPAADRTQGLFGQSMGATPKGSSKDDSPGDMIKDLQEFQRAARIY
jgi:hypothetical protein